MKYTGWMEIDTYEGSATGTAYPFGLERTRGFVDSRDVPGLLAMTEDTQTVFEVVQ